MSLSKAFKAPQYFTVEIKHEAQGTQGKIILE